MSSLSDKREFYKIPMGGENVPFYWEKHIKEFIKKFNEEKSKLLHVIYGSSPDTKNLNAYKGLVKNQFVLFEKAIEKHTGDNLK